MAARLLADDGYTVTLHARNETRTADARAALGSAEAVVVGDLRTSPPYAVSPNRRTPSAATTP
jgi:hypothetical protein